MKNQEDITFQARQSTENVAGYGTSTNAGNSAVTPPHVDTTPPLYGRPGYMAGLAGALFSRYVFRAFIAFGAEGLWPAFFGEKAVAKQTDEAITTVEKELSKAEHHEKITEIETKLASDTKSTPGVRQPATPIERRAAATAEYVAPESIHPSGKKLYNNLSKVVPHGFVRNTVEYGLTSQGKVEVTPYTRERVANKIEEAYKSVLKRRNGAIYDGTIGTFSIGFTTLFRQKVITDMKNVYSEVVAYELDKPVNQVTWKDIKNSSNGAIQETYRELNARSSWRYGTDAVFFGGLLMRGLGKLGLKGSGTAGRVFDALENKMTWSDLGIGMKGALFVNDMWRRQTTTFEKITDVVERKLKTLNGLGDPITASDLIDMHQHYAQRNEPQMAFTTVIGDREIQEERWGAAKIVFDRMAELMNQSYNYKHSLDATSADFTLPKFLYMLGQNMIDPDNPRRTLCYVEIANTHDMPALKEAVAQFARGASVKDVISEFPISLKASEVPGIHELMKGHLHEAAVQATTHHPMIHETPLAKVGKVEAHELIEKTVEHAMQHSH